MIIKNIEKHINILHLMPNHTEYFKNLNGFKNQANEVSGRLKFKNGLLVIVAQ